MATLYGTIATILRRMRGEAQPSLAPRGIFRVGANTHMVQEDSIASTVLEENLIDDQKLHPRVKDVQIYTHSFKFLTMPLHNNTSFQKDLFWMMFSADRAKISSFSLLKIYKRHFAATLYNATIYLLQVFLKHDCAVWNFKCGNKICFEMSDIHSIEQIKAFYDFDMKKSCQEFL